MTTQENHKLDLILDILNKHNVYFETIKKEFTKVHEEIAENTKDIKFLQNTTTILSSKVDNLETATASLSIKVDNLEATTAILSTKVDNLEATTAILSTKVDNLETATAILRKEVSKNTEEIQDLDLSFREVKGDFRDFRLDYKDLKEKLYEIHASRNMVQMAFTRKLIFASSATSVISSVIYNSALRFFTTL